MAFRTWLTSLRVCGCYRVDNESNQTGLFLSFFFFSQTGGGRSSRVVTVSGFFPAGKRKKERAQSPLGTRTPPRKTPPRCTIGYLRVPDADAQRSVHRPSFFIFPVLSRAFIVLFFGLSFPSPNMSVQRSRLSQDLKLSTLDDKFRRTRGTHM